MNGKMLSKQAEPPHLARACVLSGVIARSDQLRLLRIMRQEERGVKAEDGAVMLLICTCLGLI
jgi:hypothetical protein